MTTAQYLAAPKQMEMNMFTHFKLKESEVTSLIEMIDFARHNSGMASFRNECTALANKIKNQQMNPSRQHNTELAMRKNGI